jgi:hypothetical protein
MISVRVLGKCGGFTSDIVEGMRWAAGLPVPGVPNNPYPAKVLNLSLGGFGSCPLTYQSAIDAVNSVGGIVVVAAGNSNANAVNFRPASCNGVITVGATNRSGVRASYSNYGSAVDVSAPGGTSGSDGVLSTLNTGTTTPAADSYEYYRGTSMAAPHVAGVVSLMLAINPTLNFTTTETILKRTAKPFGLGHSCTGVTSCGAGIVNAYAALQAVPKRRAFLPITINGGNWVNITQESFEGVTFPPSGWTTISSGGFTWGRRNCFSLHGNFAAWAVGGGPNGSALACNSNYPNNTNVWLIYGPFDLSDAAAAQLSFRYYLNSEPGWDFLFWGTSINNSTYIGSETSGNSSGWVTFDLSSRLGQPQVWIGFQFFSDSIITYSNGAFIDSVVVRKCVSHPCISSMNLNQPEENVAVWRTAERILGIPYQPPLKP